MGEHRSNGWRQCCIGTDATLRQAMEAIDQSSMQLALIVGDHLYLKGLITDGDIRRAILRGVSLDAPVYDVMRIDPMVFRLQDSRDYVIRHMQKQKINHAPLLDTADRVLDLYSLNDLLSKQARSNPVLLMAGGLGTRLRPLTEHVPKPLLKVGNMPILETILTSFIENGFSHFYLAVNYKSEMIESYFGDGSRWDVEIEYLQEEKRLGTAGALSLLPKDLQEPIIVMNGDLLTKVDFGEFLDCHMEQSSVATMGVREYSWQVPYGVVELEGNRISRIEEKPVHRCYVNAGMYVLSPEAVHRVPAEEYLDMPDLFRGIVAEKKKTAVYPIRDYWMDIGQMDDFRQAQGEYEDVFGEHGDASVKDGSS